MANKVSISITKHPHQDEVVSMQQVTIRERLLRLLFGNPHHLMVITPGKDVQQLQINEIKEGAHECHE